MKHLLIAAATMLSGLFILLGIEDKFEHQTLCWLAGVWGFLCPIILNYWLLERDNKPSKTEY